MVTQLELNFERRAATPAPTRAQLALKLRVVRAHLDRLPDGAAWMLCKRRERELLSALRGART